jgi:hypothetical protein
LLANPSRGSRGDDTEIDVRFPDACAFAVKTSEDLDNLFELVIDANGYDLAVSDLTEVIASVVR